MSFRLPNNVPNFDNAQRRFEDNVWSRFTGTEKGLPMYKDKPAGYRARKEARRCGGKRRVALVVSVVLGLFWCWALFGPYSAVESGTKGWNIMPGIKKGNKKKADWSTRRDSVRDAFLLSWKSYEDHGWGASHGVCRWSSWRRVHRA